MTLVILTAVGVGLGIMVGGDSILRYVVRGRRGEGRREYDIFAWRDFYAPVFGNYIKI